MMFRGCMIAMASLGAPATYSPASTDEVRSCIDIQAIADTPVLDDRTIDFVVLGKEHAAYRNVLQDACPFLGVERTFSFAATGNRLCRGAPIQVLQNGRTIPGPTCLLGSFRRIAAPR